VLPLLTTARGTKFGKTESGNVWLDPARTSPWRFWQFWRGTEDADVGRFLRFFTFLPLPEIEALLETHAADPGAGLAQRRLAAEVTAMVHGPEAVTRVEAASRVLFGREPIEALDGETLAMIAEEVPRTPVAGDSLEGMPVIDALVAAGLAASKSDARRGIAGHGYSVNGVTVEQPDQVLGAGDLRGGRWVLLRKGKKQWGMLEVG
jgi:tyrosyl-tRNA synthetase